MTYTAMKVWKIEQRIEWEYKKNVELRIKKKTFEANCEKSKELSIRIF